jgi:hypothetical protein
MSQRSGLVRSVPFVGKGIFCIFLKETLTSWGIPGAISWSAGFVGMGVADSSLSFREGGVLVLMSLVWK